MQQQNGTVHYSRNGNGNIDMASSYNTFQAKGGAAPPVLPRRSPMNEKSVVEAYILAISPLGLMGAHHFYLRRPYWGILYFFTLGLAGCGYVYDWFRVPCLVKQANAKANNLGHTDVDRKTLSDAYILWFPMGLLGFHHYYLGNYGFGVAYTCTFGLAGLGWLVDAFRMPSLVNKANERQYSGEFNQKQLCTAFALGMSPLGALGAHHYYLNRPVWGILYTFTLGLMGLGWVFDWFRMVFLVARANEEINGHRHPQQKTVDDAYILWLPWGFLGFHHFYLGRPVWGIVYALTLGVAGLGWLVDMVRIPCLVRDANKELEMEQERRALAASLEQGQPGSMVIVTSTHPSFSGQGAPSGGVANPAASFGPPGPYPPQGPYTYQQQGSAYGAGNPASQAQALPPEYPPAYGSAMGGPQYPSFAPPPYQPPAQQQTSGQEASEIPRKNPV